MSSDLWGIPGTGKVPDPEKEIKKLIDRATREVQADINKISTKVEGDTKRSMARFARVTQRGITKSISQAEHGIKDAAEEAVDKVLEAVAAGTVGELLSKLVDLAQAKLITKPVTIELFWFRFNVDVNDKIDALQKWAHDPPTSADDVPDMILELCGDDEIMFVPNFPVLGRVEITVGVDQLAALVKKAL